LGFVEHRHVRLNALFIDQPIEHLSGTIARVGGKTLRVKIEAVMSSRDHGLGGSNLGLALHSSYHAGAFGEVVLAQGLGHEDRQAPRDEEGDRGAGAPVSGASRASPGRWTWVFIVVIS
jgi:hypothetical protein